MSGTHPPPVRGRRTGPQSPATDRGVRSRTNPGQWATGAGKTTIRCSASSRRTASRKISVTPSPAMIDSRIATFDPAVRVRGASPASPGSRPWPPAYRNRVPKQPGLPAQPARLPLLPHYGSQSPRGRTVTIRPAGLPNPPRSRVRSTQHVRPKSRPESGWCC